MTRGENERERGRAGRARVPAITIAAVDGGEFTSNLLSQSAEQALSVVRATVRSAAWRAARSTKCFSGSERLVVVHEKVSKMASYQ